MVHKTDLLGYDIATMEEYFEMIVNTLINGNHSSANELIHDLSKDQKKDFIDWCNIQVSENIFEGSYYCICANKALELI